MRETYIIPLADDEAGDDKFLIYRPLQALAFIGNRAMLKVVQGLREDNDPAGGDSGLHRDALKFLEDIGFLRADIAPGEPPHTLSTAVLLLTNRCQLRCTYCYAAAGEASPNVLKLETAKAVIDYTCAQAAAQKKQGYRLAFHGGGEPTLEWAVLTKAVDYARSKPLKADISVTSNAIWSDEQCEWLIEHLDSLSVSMDGGALTQNTNRPLASGKPSFPIVIKNLQRLDARGFPYGIRMTAVEPWDDLAKNIEFIAASTQCRNVQVEPAFNPARGNHGVGAPDDALKFIDAFEAAYQVAKAHQIHFRYAAARVGSVTRQFCSAPYDALVVNPDDRLVACYEVTDLDHPLGGLSDFGYVKDGTVYIDAENRQRLHALIEARWQSCQDCFCRWSCAGDCFVRTFQPGENGHRVHGERCNMNRALTVFLLLERIAEHGGVWRGLRTAGADEDRYG